MIRFIVSNFKIRAQNIKYKKVFEDSNIHIEICSSS